MGGSEGTLVIKIICTPKNQRLLALRIDYVLVTPSFPSKETFTNKIAIPSSSWHENSFQMLLVRLFWLFQCNLMRYSKTLLETFHQCNGELVTFDTWKSGSTRFSSLSTQCPTANLNKIFLPRVKTTTAWKLTPHRSKISKNWNPPGSGLPTVGLTFSFFKNWFLIIQ